MTAKRLKIPASAKLHIPPSRASQVLGALQGASGSLQMASSPQFEVKLRQTGVLPFDVLLHGGLALGRFVLVTGEFSTLKSWLSLRAVASTQAQEGLAAIIDTEHAFDPVWAAKAGVNLDELLLMQPSTGEEALDIATGLIQEHDLDLLVWDSIASTMTQEQSTKSASETDKVATLARFINRATQRLNAVNDHTAILLINQLRSKIGVTYGSPVSFPGGKAQEFYASQHVFMRKNERLKADTKTYRLGAQKTTKMTTHQVFEAELTKSKVGGPPYRSVTILWDPEQGEVDELAFAIDAGLDLGLVEVNDKGSLFSYDGLTAAKGKRFYAALQADEEKAQTLMAQVLVESCPNLVLL